MTLEKRSSPGTPSKSSRRKPDDRRRVYLALVSAIESGLREAYAKRFEQGATNKAALAEKIGCDRSLITRRLNGGENMTIKTIADLTWALGHCIEVKITDAADHGLRNDAIFDPKNVPLEAVAAVKTQPFGDWGVFESVPSVQATLLTQVAN